MLRVITHSDTFHADEVCGVALLRLLHPGCNLDLLRTRDADVIAAASSETYVLDVGKVYDPVRRRYDHHQASFTAKFDADRPFPLSSCGLVWLHHGVELLRNVYGVADDEQARALVRKAYDGFFAGIDAHDNGVNWLPKTPAATNYHNPLTLSVCLGMLNDRDGDQDGAFLRATDVAMPIISGYLRTLVIREKCWVKDRPQLEAALAAVDDTGVMVLDAPLRSTKKFLRKHDPGQRVRFIVVPRNNKQWQIWTVEYGNRVFDTFVPILKGQTDLVDPERGDFVHKNRFLAITATREAAIELAARSSRVYDDWTNAPYRLWRWCVTR